MNSFISLDNTDLNFESKNLIKGVLVIHDLEYLKEKINEFYFNINSSFIVSLEDDASIEKFIKDTSLFSLLFHKNYFFLNSLPVFKLSSSISINKQKVFYNYLNDQGYSNFYIWKEKRIKALINKNLNIYNVHYKENIAELPTLALLPTNFIYYPNLSDYNQTTEQIKELLSENEEIKLLHTELCNIWLKYSESEAKLSWTKNTLKNYKSYNKVLKNQLRDKRIINYGGKIANQIRRIGFLRKILRTLLN